MIIIDIPGGSKIEAEHLVPDYNGTLAVDGKLTDGVRSGLEQLSKKLKIHIITADTFGMSENELAGINCNLKVLSSSLQDVYKEAYIINLGKEKVVAIGNGRNDALMLKSAALGILVIQEEGASVDALLNADMVCNNIRDALALLDKPLRIVATLRR